jgi:hypothetical protein
VNFQQLVEMYANFGTWGVVLGGIILGFLYKLLTEVGDGPAVDDGAKLIAAHIFVGLLNIESNFALVFGGLVYLVLLNVLVLKILHWRKPMVAS